MIDNTICALDLGCGLHPRNVFNANYISGVDSSFEGNINGVEIKKRDLAIEKIPYQDSNFDVVTCFDFIEHIPRVIYVPERRQPFIELMNEISRVLKPGGVFFSSTP